MFYVKKNFDQKNVWKIFWSKKFKVPKLFGQKNLRIKKNYVNFFLYIYKKLVTTIGSPKFWIKKLTKI